MTMNGALETLRRLEKAGDALDAALTEAFALAGEYAVRGIRTGEMSSWNDQTGNLRSSIGYAVCSKGRIERRVTDAAAQQQPTEPSARDAALKGSAQNHGKAMAEKAIADLAGEYSSYPHVLIIVAGMSYAVYVEAIESKVVLAGARLWLDNNIGKILQARVDAAIKKIKGT